jgi:hypothetical protein
MRKKLHRLPGKLDGSPIERGRNLQSYVLLRCGRIIAEHDFSPHCQPLLLGFDADVQVIIGEGERFALDGERRKS